MSLDNLPWKTPHDYLLPPQAAWQPESFKNRTQSYRAAIHFAQNRSERCFFVFFKVKSPFHGSNQTETMLEYWNIQQGSCGPSPSRWVVCLRVPWHSKITHRLTGGLVQVYRYIPKTSTTVLPTHLSTNTDVDDKEILLAVGGGTGAGTGTGGLEMDRDIIRRTSGSTKA